MSTQTAINTASLGYNSDMKSYRALLSEKMHRAVWHRGKWAGFLGSVVSNQKEYEEGPVFGGVSKVVKATGNVIELLQDFKHKGGVSMDIPVKYPITKKAIYGDKMLKGNEAVYQFGYKKTIINQVRQGVKLQDNKMSKQVIQSPDMQRQLFSSASADLTDWFSRWISFQPYYALLRNYSDNITETTANGGLQKTVIHHPNMYIAGAGKIAGLPYDGSGGANATYATDLADAITGMLAAGDETKEGFSLKALENMIYYASQCKMQRASTPFGEKYFLFITGSQALQLRKDPDFKDVWKYAGDRGKDNPLISGAMEIDYLNTLILVDDIIPSVNVAEGVITYGNTDEFMANPVSSGDAKPAFLIGASAITAGYGDKLSFANEDDDYQQILASGADMICGFQRADITDDDNRFGGGAGSFVENNSSLVLVTNSPSNGVVSW